jgi:hypothetical protein
VRDTVIGSRELGFDFLRVVWRARGRPVFAPAKTPVPRPRAEKANSHAAEDTHVVRMEPCDSVQVSPVLRYCPVMAQHAAPGQTNARIHIDTSAVDTRERPSGERRASAAELTHCLARGTLPLAPTRETLTLGDRHLRQTPHGRATVIQPYVYLYVCALMCVWVLLLSRPCTGARVAGTGTRFRFTITTARHHIPLCYRHTVCDTEMLLPSRVGDASS